MEVTIILIMLIFIIKILIIQKNFKNLNFKIFRKINNIHRKLCPSEIVLFIFDKNKLFSVKEQAKCKQERFKVKMTVIQSQANLFQKLWEGAGMVSRSRELKFKNQRNLIRDKFTMPKQWLLKNPIYKPHKQKHLQITAIRLSAPKAKRQI